MNNRRLGSGDIMGYFYNLKNYIMCFNMSHEESHDIIEPLRIGLNEVFVSQSMRCPFNMQWRVSYQGKQLLQLSKSENEPDQVVSAHLIYPVLPDN